jgi:PPOX class probable F420-dependent enzyme
VDGRLALPQEIEGFIADARVGRLATVDREGQPHVVPCCYAWDGYALYSAIDAKPKRGGQAPLRRVRNIEENPRVSLVIDHYAEDWGALRWVMIQGRAELVGAGAEYAHGASLLLSKYPQYRAMGLDPARGPMIKVVPERVTHWSGAT